MIEMLLGVILAPWSTCFAASADKLVCLSFLCLSSVCLSVAGRFFCFFINVSMDSIKFEIRQQGFTHRKRKKIILNKTSESNF